ncbi:probable serine/threonine-protein kinase PBL7 [Sesamum indicum]|uniref:Probable serine/threonine-protein kinase PBL7 n=1 Tax=Sesamum indicum TaxID=4182 RepID=A0A6I9TDL0_SESIN|nr:probable serine/threonine-protein kinase PBL7 [Sesamum indicum]
MENLPATSPPPSNGIIHSHHHHLEHVPQTHGHHHEIIPSSSLLIVVIPIIIVILLLAILLLTLMLRRLQLSRDTTTTSTTVATNGGCLRGSGLSGTPQPKLRGAQQVQVQVFSLKEVETATNKFSEANIIGNGASGAVYRGVLRDGTAAAIKMFRSHGRYGERAFRLEVDLLSRLRSPYISELLGYCADQHHRLLVFEYMPNGSLHSHLRRTQSPLNWAIRLKIALDSARALEYLHEHTTPAVIHRNLKSTNILLDHNFRPKLSGFGLAKIGSDKLNGLISTRVLGTTGYLAPEYASTGKLTTKSDVYSYGVILLELLTGRVPFDTTRPPGEHVLVSWALPRLTNRDKVMEMIDPALDGQYSKKDLIQVAAITAMCVQPEADYRPLITDVVQSLMPLVKKNPVAASSNSLRFGHSPSPRA